MDANGDHGPSPDDDATLQVNLRPRSTGSRTHLLFFNWLMLLLGGLVVRSIYGKMRKEANSNNGPVLDDEATPQIDVRSRSTRGGTYLVFFKWLVLLLAALSVRSAFESMIVDVSPSGTHNVLSGDATLDFDLTRAAMLLLLFFSVSLYVFRYIATSPWRIYDRVITRSESKNWSVDLAGLRHVTLPDTLISCAYLMVEFFLAYLMVQSLASPAMVFFLILLMALFDLLFPLIIIMVAGLATFIVSLVLAFVLVLVDWKLLPLIINVVLWVALSEVSWVAPSVLAGVVVIVLLRRLVLMKNGANPRVKRLVTKIMNRLETLIDYCWQPFLRNRYILIDVFDVLTPIGILAILDSGLALELVSSIKSDLLLVVSNLTDPATLLVTYLSETRRVLDEMTLPSRDLLLLSLSIGGPVAFFLSIVLNRGQYATLRDLYAALDSR